MINSLTLLILTIFLTGCLGKNAKVSCQKEMMLWYEKPAQKWEEALPLGNGRMGAMVFGGINRERIQLNEESLWAGEPTNPYPEKAVAKLKQLQHLL